MKKDSNPLIALWQKIFIDGNIYDIAKKYRKQINLPENGCNSTDESYVDWHNRNIGDDAKKEQKRVDVCNQFINLIIEKMPFKHIVDETQFRLTLITFFLNGHIDLSSIDAEDGQFGVFKTLWIKDGERKLPTSNIEDGVYIKIGAYSSMDNIKKYITKHSELIKAVQEVFLYSEKLPKSIKLYSMKNHRRDTIINFLNSFSREKLIRLSTNKKHKQYKNELITSIMNNKYGYKSVDSYIVKMAIHRRRIGRNSLIK